MKRTHKDQGMQEHYNRYMAEYNARRGKEKRETVLNHFGGMCARCGDHNLNHLLIHHPNRDGHIHRSQVHKDVYSHLIKNNFEIEFEVEVLCANCHMEEHRTIPESGYVPREYKRKL